MLYILSTEQNLVSVLRILPERGVGAPPWLLFRSTSEGRRRHLADDTGETESAEMISYSYTVIVMLHIQYACCMVCTYDMYELYV